MATISPAELYRNIQQLASALQDLRSEQIGFRTQLRESNDHTARSHDALQQAMDQLEVRMQKYLEGIQVTHEDNADAVGWKLLGFGLLIGLCALTWSGASILILLAPLVGVTIPVCFPQVRRILRLAYQRIMTKLESALLASTRQGAVVAAGADGLAQTVEHRPDLASRNGNGRH